MLADLGDVTLWYDVAGSALTDDAEDRPLLIAVHGGPGSDHFGLRYRMEPLTEHMQVVYFDQRGHGRSDYSDAKHWNLKTWATDLRNFCDHIGATRPIVLGSSFGGFVVMQYARMFPDHPAGIILANTSGRDDPALSIEVFRRLGGDRAADAARQDFEQMTEDSSKVFDEICLPLYGAAPGYAERLAHDQARSIHTLDVNLHFFRSVVGNMDSQRSAEGIRCPVLVLAGEDDPVCVISVVEELTSVLPPDTTRFVRLPGARHAIFADRPDLVYPEVIDFVSKYAAAPPIAAGSVKQPVG